MIESAGGPAEVRPGNRDRDRRGQRDRDRQGDRYRSVAAGPRPRLSASAACRPGIRFGPRRAAPSQPSQ